MSEMKSYVGSCHCGQVRYRVDADLSGVLATCNCSMCKRMGWIMAFVPAGQFTLEQGADRLTDYQFNKKNIHHLFCSTCGIRSFSRGTTADGSPTYAVNVRCLEGVDPNALTTKEFDGASL